VNPYIPSSHAASTTETKVKRVSAKSHPTFAATSKSQRTVPVQTMLTPAVQPVRILFRGIPESGLND
jgi:hypothetical protein